MATSAPSPTAITGAQFTRLLSLYPSVVKRVYGAKIKDSKKLAQALEDDAWRYDGLVKLVAGRRGKGESAGGWLEKPELERLVRWKITHGTNRPFLPAQIRKNEASAVQTATSAGFKAQQTASPAANNAFPTDALNHLTALTGVGPATATLLLSIADPTNVPFFQDELFHWLCNDDDESGGEKKLKYNMKEYKALFEKVADVRQRLKFPGGVAEVEKVGFVVGHLDVVDEGEREDGEAVLAQPNGGEGRPAAKEEGEVSGGAAKKGRLEEKVPMPASVPEKEMAKKAKAKTKAKTPKTAEEASKTVSTGTRKRTASAAETAPTTTRKSQRAR